MIVQSPYYDLLKQADECKLRGDHQEAIRICQSILYDDLKCTEAYEEIGDNYMNLREYDKAVAALMKAIELNPDSANAHYLLGFSKSAKNEWKESVQILERANKLEPNHPEILRCLGWSIFHHGRQNQGLIVLTRALNMAPNDCFIMSDLGMCYLGTREFDKAEEIFSAIVNIEPHNNRAHECLEACRYFKNKTK